ncbi:MAG: bifunctional aspartate kinase/diaminopimelate decarboxylase [Gammaproteobacteria bacterium]|nr:bifunctional aspartate kinase/diaminopimelate decarboxylase [Gammaproteobacteria bacterium]
MRQVIIKFGGTSVSSRETWEHIKTITENHIKQGAQPIIVCSAHSKASNKLDQMADAALYDKHHHLHDELIQAYTSLAQSLDVDPKHIESDFKQLKQWLTGIALLNEAPAKTRAQILSLGELMLTRLGHIFLEQNKVSCTWFDAREALKTTPVLGGDSVNYLNAYCAGEKNTDLAYQLANSGTSAIITQGFIASNEAGETVLLGRGGSDTSAALLAASLEADACEIWTDVPGIYTANPHQLPHARLLKQLNYNEAQEIASMGAKVLHPPCIPPVRRANIPLFVKYTKMPKHSGTRITQDSDNTAPPIKSIQVKHSITLISIDTLTMWQQVGFLSDVFAVFRQHEFSVDLLSSSEFNVTVSLDSNGLSRPRKALDALLVDLNQLGRAKIIEPCSAVSLVGHHIRTVLPQLGPALEVFEAKQIYLMSLASNDLNLTFVVDESQANKLSQQLHTLLIENNPQSFYYSKSFQEQFGTPSTRQAPWWETSREALLCMAETKTPCYVYHAPTIAAQADKLQQLKTVDQLFYAIKANSNANILKVLETKGIGFECVSIEELQHILKIFPKIEPNRILFTPNFAPKSEYEFALSIGCHITIDSLYPLDHWPELFTGHDILLRIDPGSGAGHHKYVCTGGNESKFGIPRETVARAALLTKQHNIRVVGLHAHSGSGILSPDLWQETALMLIDEAKQFPDARVINLGGGLGIVDKPSQHPLDMSAFDASLKAVKSQDPRFAFWLEPGRFFVAESGVILAHVTQCKTKGRVRFIGIDTGMNSLIRPMLYGAYHEIVNLSRLTEEKTGFAHIVGPICESADTLGYDRLLPETHENDVLLIANTGAYGYCMGSSYNLREPAKELMFDAC